jgi:hypothetical protein
MCCLLRFVAEQSNSLIPMMTHLVDPNYLVKYGSKDETSVSESSLLCKVTGGTTSLFLAPTLSA